MVVKFKAIKPRPLDLKCVREELRRAMDNEIKPTLLADHEQTVRGWERKVSFRTWSKVGPRGTPIEVRVYTTDEVWNYLDKGTRPHVIRAKRAKNLRFRAGPYTPKTIPGRLVSGRGGYAAGPWVSTPEVMHPGTEARNWTKMIMEKRRQWFDSTMTSAMWRGLQKTGHARKKK